MLFPGRSWLDAQQLCRFVAAEYAQRKFLSRRSGNQRCRWLATDIARIQTARHGMVGGSFDDGAAIAEERYFVGLAPELQHEFIVTNVTVRLQPGLHLHEIHLPVPLMDLDRVAPA